MKQPSRPYNYHFISPGHTAHKQKSSQPPQYQFQVKKTQLNFQYSQASVPPQNQSVVKSMQIPSSNIGEVGSSHPARKYTFEMIKRVDEGSNKMQNSSFVSPFQVMTKEERKVGGRDKTENAIFERKQGTLVDDNGGTPKARTKTQHILDGKNTQKKTELSALQVQVLKLAEQNQELRKELSEEKEKAERAKNQLEKFQKQLMKDKNTICVKDGRITDLEDDRNRLKKEIESLKQVIQNLKTHKNPLKSTSSLISLTIKPQNQQKQQQKTQQPKQQQTKQTLYQSWYKQIAEILTIDTSQSDPHGALTAQLIVLKQEAEEKAIKIDEVKVTTDRLLKHLSKQQGQMLKLHHVNAILSSQLHTANVLIQDLNSQIIQNELTSLEHRLNLPQIEFQ